MSMSTYVYGIKPADGKWEKMIDVFEACIEAGVSIPSEVNKFFDGKIPDPAGVIIELDGDTGVYPFNDDGESGYTVEISKLPPDVKMIRFVNSW